MKVNFAILILCLRAIYPVMRPILQDSIDDPNSEWDEVLMRTLDVLVMGETIKPNEIVERKRK